METLGIKSNSVYEIFKNEIYFDGQHYIASLPFKPHHKPTPDNFMLSKHRLRSLKNKLNRDPDLKRESMKSFRIILKRESLKEWGMRGYQEKLIICSTEQSCDTTKKQQNLALFSMTQQRSINVDL